MLSLPVDVAGQATRTIPQLTIQQVLLESAVTEQDVGKAHVRAQRPGCLSMGSVRTAGCAGGRFAVRRMCAVATQMLCSCSTAGDAQ